MVQQFKRLMGRTDIRILFFLVAVLVLSSLVLAVARTTKPVASDEALVSSWGDIRDRYLALRAQSYALATPVWFLNQDSIEDVINEYGLAALQDSADWYCTIDGGELLFFDKSPLSKQIPDNAELVIYVFEDIVGEELLIVSASTEGAWKEEAVFRAPKWPRIGENEDYENFLWQELSERRLMLRLTLKSEAQAEKELEEAELSALSIPESGDGGMFLMSGGAETNQLHFVQIGRTGTNGEVVVTVEYPGAYAGGVWELFSYDFPWTATGETARFMGLDSVWDIAETNLVLQTGTNQTSWTDSGQWGRPAPETSQYHRAYSACSSQDQDEDGLSDGWEQLSSKTSTTDEDSDNDGLNDGDEVKVHGTNPLDSDSDDDTLSDATEVANRTDPWNDDTTPPSVVLSVPPASQAWRILP